MTLPHHYLDCTGHWKHEVVGNHLFWRCRKCRALVYHSDEVADAAILENCLGSVLQELTAVGKQLLDGEWQKS